MLRAARKKKISSRFLCPCPPLLLSAPNQNCHATQANHNYAPQHCIFHKVSTIIVGGALCKENLLLPSWVRHRREGSAWIVWSFWSHWSPNFGTIPSCSLSSNWFSKCERIHLLINQWPWLQACWTKCRAIRPGFKTVSKHILNKDFTWLTQILSRVQYMPKLSEWKALQPGCWRWIQLFRCWIVWSFDLRVH